MRRHDSLDHIQTGRLTASDALVQCPDRGLCCQCAVRVSAGPICHCETWGVHQNRILVVWAARASVCLARDDHALRQMTSCLSVVTGEVTATAVGTLTSAGIRRDGPDITEP